MFRFLSFLLLALGLTLIACSETTNPPGGDSPPDNRGFTGLEGSIQPAEGTFVLRRLNDSDPDGTSPIPVDLIGRNLVVDPTSQTVSVDVALRNAGPVSLYGPVLVWLNDFRPAGVELINPDIVLVSEGDPLPPTSVVGFDYSTLLGEDSALMPNELSGVRTWIFRVPELQAFAFAARAEFGLTPHSARIGGIIFDDQNENGQLDPGERPVSIGRISVQGPLGEVTETHPAPDGRYAVPAEHAGLYELHYLASPGHDFPIVTTPNPLTIVLPPDEEGQPISYLDADFGVKFAAPPNDSLCEATQLTDRSLQELNFAAWNLIDVIRDGDLLFLHIGFSGCDQHHPFTLYMSGGIMESEPPQVNLLLVHELDEACDAYFETRLCFDLTPIRRIYVGGDNEPEPHRTLILRVHNYELEVARRVEYTF